MTESRCSQEVDVVDIKYQAATFTAHDGLTLYRQSWLPAATDIRGSVLLVHGFGEHSRRYENVVRSLTPAGFAIHGFDLRGHGHSPGQRGFISSWDDFREDVHELVRVITEAESSNPLFLLGHSLGGVIVLDYALHYPNELSGVVAIGPAIGEISISPILMTAGRVISRVWPSFSLHSGLDTSGFSRDMQVLADYRADSLIHDRGTARLATETERTVAWVQTHASEFQVPLLIQHGESDRIAYPDGSRRFITNAGTSDKTLIEYPGAFHQVHNDVGHEEVMNDLLDWLEHHMSASPGTSGDETE